VNIQDIVNGIRRNNKLAKVRKDKKELYYRRKEMFQEMLLQRRPKELSVRKSRGMIEIVYNVLSTHIRYDLAKKYMDITKIDNNLRQVKDL